MDKDSELQEWDRTRQPMAPDTAYPRPTQPNPVTGVEAGKIRGSMEQLLHYGLYVKSTRNNTITTVSSPTGERLKTYSGGICGFKGNRRSSYEAGYQCAIKAIEFLQEVKEKDTKRVRVNLFLNGFGQGRDAMHKALITSEGEVVRKSITMVTDITAMKIGGTRAKKKRRS